MATLHVLRVFADEDGEWGNPLGAVSGIEAAHVATLHVLRVFCDEDGSTATRSASSSTAPRCPRSGARRSPTSSASRRRSSSTTARRRPMPDLHAGAGAALRRPPDGRHRLAAGAGGRAGARCCGRRPARSGCGARATAEALTFVAARAEWSPPWELIELRRARPRSRRSTGRPAGSEDCDLLLGLGGRGGRAGCARAAARSRTGSARTRRRARRRSCSPRRPSRELTIHQGEGSLLRARPLGDGRAEVGGGCALDVLDDCAVSRTSSSAR